MSSKNHAERLSHALEATRLVQAVNVSFDEGRVSVIFRVLQGAEPAWMRLVKALKVAERLQSDQIPAWSIDVSKPYLLKNENLVFGWRVIVASADISGTLDLLNGLLKGEPLPAEASRELSEFPFTGFAPGTADRNEPNHGKGVYRINGKEHPLKG